MAGDSTIKTKVLGDSRDAQRAMREYAKSLDDAQKRMDAFNTKAGKALGNVTLGISALPVAAAAAGIATAGALAVVPLLFAGIAAAALSNSEKIGNALDGMSQKVGDGIQEAAKPLEGTFVAAIGKVGSAFERVQPEIEDAMRASGKSVLILTDGVTGLVENAMPGLVTAAQNSEAPMQGLAEMLQKTGTGASEMFVNMSAGSESSGRIMSEFGSVVRDLLSEVGTLFANLSNGGVGAFDALNGVLGQAYGALNKLTTNGMPLAMGAFSGLTNVASGTLGVLTSLLGLLGNWAAPLGAVGGAIFGVNKILGVFGTSLGATGGGLNAFTKSIGDGPNKISPFTESLKKADKDGTSKFKAGLGSIVSSGFNPMGVAIIAGGLLLDLYGRQQQEAAKKAAEHKDAVNTLTEAIRRDNGVVGESTRAATQKALADKNVQGNLTALGISYGEATEGVLGNAEAMSKTKGLLADNLDMTVRQAGANNESATTWQIVSREMASSGDSAEIAIGKYGNVQKIFDGMTQSQKDSTLANLNANQALQQQVKTYEDAAIAAHQSEQAQKLVPLALQMQTVAAQELSAAFETVASAAGSATDKGSALVTILDRLSGRVPSFEESSQALNDQLRTLGEGFDTTTKGAGRLDKSLLNADGTINTLTANGSTLQNKMNSLEKSVGDTVGSFGDMVKSGMPMGDALVKIGSQVEDTRDRFIKQARAMGFNQEAAVKMADAYHLNTNAMGPMLAGLSEQDLATAKVKRTVDALGNAVYTLPDGKQIKVDADTEGASAAVHKFTNETEATTARTTVGANIDPATNNVLAWQNTTFQTKGDTTTYTNTDPATGAVTEWKVTTDAKGARTTTSTTTDPATGAVSQWKRNTDGTWSRTNVDANMGPADRAARDWVPPNKTATLTYFATVRNPPGGFNASAQTGPAKMNATGNILAFANGGMAQRMQGGLAQMVNPGTLRVIGDNMRSKESYIPIDGSSRSLALLSQTANEMGYQLAEMGSSLVSVGSASPSASSGGGDTYYNTNVYVEGSLIGTVRELTKLVTEEQHRQGRKGG